MPVPSKFEQANIRLTPPGGMTKEECNDLWVWSDGKYCLSKWTLSWKERFSLLFGKPIWLWVISGKSQPPVAFEITESPFKPSK